MEAKNKTSSTDQAHVLVVTYPAQGHLNPMLQFSKRLVSKIVRVTLAVTVSIYRFLHVEPTSGVEIETISDGFDEGRFRGESPEEYQKGLRVVGARTLRSLIQRLDASGKPVHAVIYNGVMPWALDVAKEFGKLGAAFLTQSCAVNNIYYHVRKGLVELPLEGPMVAFPGLLPPLDPSDLPSFICIPESYPVYYELLVNQFANIEEADYVLVNTFYELEKKEADWMSESLPLKTIGPMVPSIYLDKRLEDDRDYSLNLFKPNNEGCTSWLSCKPPRSVVYVSFGSLAVLPVEQMAELAAALDQIRHRYSFLWIVREPEKSKLPSHFVAEDESGFVLAWCSQLEVLHHDSIGCFLTHCGMSSVLEAISLGVPMVAIPQWTDQPTNAKYVEDVWGIGLRVRPDKSGLVGREELGLRIEEVMEGEKGKVIRENVKKWKDLAREAMDEGGSSDKNIDEFVGKLLSSRD